LFLRAVMRVRRWASHDCSPRDRLAAVNAVGAEPRFVGIEVFDGRPVGMDRQAQLIVEDLS
jgi:hypothetical protein